MQVKDRVTSPHYQPNPATHHQQDTQGRGRQNLGSGSLAPGAIPIAALSVFASARAQLSLPTHQQVVPVANK